MFPTDAQLISRVRERLVRLTHGKAVLAQIGIPVVREVVLPADIEKLVALVLGFPVAVKVLCHAISRTEVGDAAQCG